MSRYFPSQIEKKWQEKWLKAKIYEPSFAKASKGKPDLLRTKKPFYNLMMFPYPSAEGLHIGGVRTFTGIDIYGRFKRMQGFDVFEPMGLDGFGIHSENYALKIRKHPMLVAKQTEKNFYRQLGAMGNGFAWDERLETYDPNYYRWTQWIFIQMFKRGLAYRKKAEVNWCPLCKTVLADEQVIAGACERCSAVVIKKELEQWFFKITNYADRLLKNLETIDWSDDVKIAQKNWIGKSEGAEIEFKISLVPRHSERSEESHSQRSLGLRPQDDRTHGSITVFTTRPDTLFGTTYLVLAPEHELIALLKTEISNAREVEAYQKKTSLMAEIDRIAEGKEKTGVELKGITAINPANNEEMPVWISDYVLAGVGTGAIMAVPAHDERDWEFAKKFKLKISCVIDPTPLEIHASNSPQTRRNPEELREQFESEKKRMTEWREGILRGEEVCLGNGKLVNSGEFDGMDSEEAKWPITKSVGGKKKTNFRLRDWLISRQRYWGPPIPMIFCKSCYETRRGERKDMLGWYTVLEKNLPVKLPFIKDARPTGTDKSPLANIEKFYKVRCPACKAWARRETDVSDTFLDSAWYYLRYPSVRDTKHAWDPKITKKWFPVDMYIGGKEHSVLHLLYVRFLAMAFYDWKMIPFCEPFKKFRSHGLITKDGVKMSKSRGNVVNPDEYISAYGADTMRMYLAFMAPLDQGGDFRDAGIAGITRFLNRVWKMTSEKQKAQNRKQQLKTEKNTLQKAIHKTIKKVGEDIENLQYNTAISALMILLNECEAHADELARDDIAIFLKLLAPFAPHMTEELWQAHGFLRSKKFASIHHEPWPLYQEKFLREKSQEFAIQVNGKLRDTFTAPVDIKEQEAVRLTLAREKVKNILSGQTPKKIIFVPGRLVNVVV